MSKIKFKKSPLALMDMLRYVKITSVRRQKMSEAPAKPLPKTYSVNELARALHPRKQFAVITDIIQRTEDTKSFVFAPDAQAGTTKFAYFKAGQYLALTIEINGKEVARPYTISSSPKEALEGKYELTVKRDGYVSGYLFDNAKLGDKVVFSDPSGDFGYSALRDAKRVVAVCGGSGITPFMSMAKAVADGTEDFELIVLYGSKTLKDIIFRKELDALQCDKVKVVYVLSEKKSKGCKFGFITKEMIGEYGGDGDYSVFVCGSPAMNVYLDKELAPLGLSPRRLRKEKNCIANYPDNDPEIRVYKLSVLIRDDKYETTASENETLLTALERAGIPCPSKCRAGGCGFCRSRLISGEFYVPDGRDGRRAADKEMGYVHPCVAFPRSDMALDVPVNA